MSHSTPSNTKFVALSVLIVLASASTIAALWPAVHRYKHAEAGRLVIAGQQASGQEAVANFRLATWLNPQSEAAHLGLARTSLATGQTNTALQELAKAGEGSEVMRLKLRTHLELEQANQAIAAAQTLGNAPAATQADLVLACLAFAAGNQPANCDALKPRLSSAEALERVTRAQTAPNTLAAELLASELPKSATAILVKLPVSFQRNLWLGHIYFNQRTVSSLSEAADIVTAALDMDPSSIEAHQLLANIYTLQDKPEAAQAQTELTTKLISGRP